MWLTYWYRPKIVGVEDGEQRCIETEPQAYGDNYRQDECGGTAKTPEGIADILEQRRNHSDTANVSAFLRNSHSAAKLNTSLTLRFSRAHAGRAILLCLHLDMKFQLIFEFSVELFTKRKGT
jgi:hypothetical protein